MSTKKLKKVEPVEQQIVKTVKDSAHQIWLAGLGAFGKAQSEGIKIFETLVQEGEKFQTKTKHEVEEIKEDLKDATKAAKDSTKAAKVKLTDTWDKLEQIFEERVALALNQLGVPSRGDIRDLNQRMEELSKNIQELTTIRNLPSRQTGTPAAK